MNRYNNPMPDVGRHHLFWRSHASVHTGGRRVI
jgi:hypothetical protein